MHTVLFLWLRLHREGDKALACLHMIELTKRTSYICIPENLKQCFTTVLPVVKGYVWDQPLGVRMWCAWPIRQFYSGQCDWLYWCYHVLQCFRLFQNPMRQMSHPHSKWWDMYKKYETFFSNLCSYLFFFFKKYVCWRLSTEIAVWTCLSRSQIEQLKSLFIHVSGKLFWNHCLFRLNNYFTLKVSWQQSFFSTFFKNYCATLWRIRTWNDASFFKMMRQMLRSHQQSEGLVLLGTVRVEIIHRFVGRGKQNLWLTQCR